MGIHWGDGYSATVEAYLLLPGQLKVRLAKTNGVDFILAEPCELAAGTECELVIVVDGTKESKTIVMPDGVVAGQTRVKYETSVPF